MDTRVHIDQSHCKVCTTCVDACSTGALGLEGREITAAEAVSELLQDASLYSNGCRVILSGGEVLAQPEFALEVLRLCKKASADTAIESCLYASWETIERFLPLVDEFFVYIKYLNPQIHKAVTGVDNERILDNYIRLVRVKANVTVRTLLVPGYTAAKGNIRAIARFIANNDPAAKYELVRFNSQCRVKYAALERVYPVKDIHLSENEIARYYEILRREGIRQIIREVPCESSSAVSS